MLRKSTLAMALAAALGVALSIRSAWALGLGALRTQSALNQPFYAEIDLENLRADAIDTLQVRLASADDFARAGIERPHFLTRLQFTAMVGAAGEPLVEITSREPVREPFLNFLIEAIWPAGRLLKEYTILLDPPSVAARRMPALAQPVAGAARRLPPALAPAPRPEFRWAAVADSSVPAIPAPPPTLTSAAPVPTTPPLAAAEIEFPLRYGPVPSGAGLSRIARSMAPLGATVAQTAMAMYRSNQDAFPGGNINRLRVGAVLTIPSAAELFALDVGAAERDFRDAMAGRSVTAAPLAADGARLTMAGNPTPLPTEDFAPAVVPTAAPNPDPADTPAMVAMAAPEFPAQSDPTPEPMADLALDPAPGPVAGPMLEPAPELVPTPPAVTTVTNGPTNGASAGAPIGAAPTDPTTAAPPRPETAALHGRISDLEAQLSTILQLLEERNEQLGHLQTERGVPADATTPRESEVVAGAGAVLGPEAAPAPARPPPAATQPPPASPPAPTPTGIPVWPVAGLLGVVALGGLSWLAYRRRVRQSALPARDSAGFEAEAPAPAAPVAVPNAVSMGAASSVSPPQEVRTAPTAEPMLSGVSSTLAETREADVLTEADILILYGRYRDAEALLREELALTPERAELRFKLADAYLRMGHRDALAALAAEMEANGEAGIAPAEWQAITQALAAISATSASAPPREPRCIEPAARIGDLTEPAGVDLGLYEQFQAVPASSDFPDWRNLRMVDPDADSDAEVSDPGESMVENLASDILSSPGRDDFDLWDEAATKLDLACAHLELEDPDAARTILEEVEQGGNDKQRAEAGELMQRIG